MRPFQALFQNLKQVLWALLLIYLILTSTGLLFAQYIGYQNALTVCLAVAVLLAATFTVIFLFSVVWFYMDRRSEKKQDF